MANAGRMANLLVMLSASLLILGFNTLDWMVWTFYWHAESYRQWFPLKWVWAPWLTLDVWLSYFFGGIVPLVLGSFLLGHYIEKI